MPRLRITKIDEYQFLTCLKHSLWGSKASRFKDWREGDFLAFVVDKALAGLAKVTGKPFKSKEKVWDKDIYPHRIPINFIHVLAVEQRIPILGEVRDVLTSVWGPRYGLGILNQQVLDGTAAETIIKVIQSRHNRLAMFETNIEQLLTEAKQIVIIPKKKGELRHPPKEILGTEEVFKNEKEESSHSKAQAALIRLGKITGCAVWIASNDRNRLFKGKPLGGGTLKSLPNLGLNEEAMRRISLIDTIWIRQNAPVCAFEVETTTSIYSGLLRMADLLSVVPALKLNYLLSPLMKDRTR